MKIIYQRQLPGRPPKTRVIEGWLAGVVGVLALLGFVIFLIFLIPVVLIGILAFLGFVLFLIIVSWIYLARKIGFRSMWELTKIFLGFPGGSLEEKWRRVMREWENRKKGRTGEWIR